MSKKIIHTKNLTIGYTSKKSSKIIASRINLSFEKGKLIALLGKNGSGKSTLLKTLSNSIQKIEGQVFIKNKDIEKYTNLELSKQLSLVLTERLPESQLTVFELIALGRQPYTNWIDKLSDEDYTKINLAIEQTEIEHLKNNRFYELSDGQLQRVLIARALAQDTPIIILDEPTAHLDIHHTFKIFSLLKKLVDTTQKTIIISTHKVNLAIQLANKLVLLSDEKIYSGSSKELVKQNAFNNLFPKELIHFNKTLEQFIIKKN